MKRPVGVILSSVVLGCFAGLQIVSGLGSVLAAIFLRNFPTPPAPSDPNLAPYAQPAALQGFLTATFLAEALILLLLAAWAVATLVGLLRLRNWARYSVLIIGGCLAGLGGLAALGTLAVARLMPKTAVPSTLPPHTMQLLYVFEAIIFALTAGIGVWWLVYFNLRSTKTHFHPAKTPALPIDSTFPPPPPIPYTPPPPGRFSNVPVAVIILACLFFFASISCLLYTLLPFPAFLLGVIVDGPAARMVYLGIGLFTGSIGLGLLRLDNRARLAALSLIVVAVANVIVMPTSWYRARMAAYMAQIYARMHLPVFPATLFLSWPLMLFSAIFGLSLYLVIGWILYHYRDAFKPSRATPPEPRDTAPTP